LNVRSRSLYYDGMQLGETGVKLLGRAILLLSVLAVAATADAQERKLPYWASISTGDALMRTGPERTYPAIWRYRRRDLPVKVIQIYGNWRRIREQDGTEGWMLSTLLSIKRTAVITGQFNASMFAKPSTDAPLNWQAEPGVVGNISECEAGWCLFDVGGKKGYVSYDRIWGVNPGETVE
jgi:SH3-like domain-containing protein